MPPAAGRPRPQRRHRVAAEPGVWTGDARRRALTPRSTTQLSGLGLQPGTLRAVLMDRLTRSLGRDPDSATQRDIYNALSMAVREELAARWLATQRRVSEAGVKRVCYLSVEFLLGRSLINGLASLDGDLVEEARAALAEMGHDLDRIAEEETDPGLGNGGLGSPRRLLSRFARHPAVSGGRLRHPLRLRDLHPDDRRGWPPARNRKQLAASLQPVGDSARRRQLRDPLRRPLRHHAGRAGHASAPAGSRRITSGRLPTTS